MENEQENNINEVTEEKSQNNELESPKKKEFFISLIILVILAMLGTTAYYFYGEDGDDIGNNEPVNKNLLNDCDNLYCYFDNINELSDKNVVECRDENDFFKLVVDNKNKKIKSEAKVDDETTLYTYTEHEIVYSWNSADDRVDMFYNSFKKNIDNLKPSLNPEKINCLVVGREENILNDLSKEDIPPISIKLEFGGISGIDNDFLDYKENTEYGNEEIDLTNEYDWSSKEVSIKIPGTLFNDYNKKEETLFEGILYETSFDLDPKQDYGPHPSFAYWEFISVDGEIINSEPISDFSIKDYDDIYYCVFHDSIRDEYGPKYNIIGTALKNLNTLEKVESIISIYELNIIDDKYKVVYFVEEVFYKKDDDCEGNKCYYNYKKRYQVFESNIYNK